MGLRHEVGSMVIRESRAKGEMLAGVKSLMHFSLGRSVMSKSKRWKLSPPCGIEWLIYLLKGTVGVDEKPYRTVRDFATHIPCYL